MILTQPKPVSQQVDAMETISCKRNKETG